MITPKKKIDIVDITLGVDVDLTKLDPITPETENKIHKLLDEAKKEKEILQQHLIPQDRIVKCYERLTKGEVTQKELSDISGSTNVVMLMTKLHKLTKERGLWKITKKKKEGQMHYALLPI